MRVEFHHATLAAKLLAGYHGGTAAAEDIEHDFTLSAAALDAASSKGNRFRGGMTATFGTFLATHSLEIPYIGHHVVRIIEVCPC